MDGTDPHNPDGLTDEQVGVADGWRLLDEYEITPQYDNVQPHTCQLWLKMSQPAWGCLYYSGGSVDLTYQTKLTRVELRLARNQPPESAAGAVDEWVKPRIVDGSYIFASHQKNDVVEFDGRGTIGIVCATIIYIDSSGIATLVDDHGEKWSRDLCALGRPLNRNYEGGNTQCPAYVILDTSINLATDQIAPNPVGSNAATPTQPPAAAATDTPETDAKVKDGHRVPIANFYDSDNYPKYVHMAFARDLERRLTAARAELAMAQDGADKGEAGRRLGTAFEEVSAELEKCKSERDEATKNYETARHFLVKCAEERDASRLHNAMLRRVLVVTRDRLEWAIQFLSEDPFKPWDNANEWLPLARQHLCEADQALATPADGLFARVVKDITYSKHQLEIVGGDFALAWQTLKSLLAELIGQEARQ